MKVSQSTPISFPSNCSQIRHTEHFQQVAYRHGQSAHSPLVQDCYSDGAISPLMGHIQGLHQPQHFLASPSSSTGCHLPT